MANRFIYEEALAINHIVLRSLLKLKQGDGLTEAMLSEVNHRDRNDVPVAGSVKEFFAVAAPSRIVTAAKRNLGTARGTWGEWSHDNFD